MDPVRQERWRDLMVDAAHTMALLAKRALPPRVIWSRGGEQWDPQGALSSWDLPPFLKDGMQNFTGTLLLAKSTGTATSAFANRKFL